MRRWSSVTPPLSRRRIWRRGFSRRVPGRCCRSPCARTPAGLGLNPSPANRGSPVSRGSRGSGGLGGIRGRPRSVWPSRRGVVAVRARPAPRVHPASPEIREIRGTPARLESLGRRCRARRGWGCRPSPAPSGVTTAASSCSCSATPPTAPCSNRKWCWSRCSAHPHPAAVRRRRPMLCRLVSVADEAPCGVPARVQPDHRHLDAAGREAGPVGARRQVPEPAPSAEELRAPLHSLRPVRSLNWPGSSPFPRG